MKTSKFIGRERGKFIDFNVYIRKKKGFNYAV